MIKLGVNIDHVATLREARGEFHPDPLEAARACVRAGAHSIVAHLREDRRHIQDHDIVRLKKFCDTADVKFNLEMSINAAIVRIAKRLRPDQATLVPERRQELTTEGGLDVVRNFARVKCAVAALQKSGITVSLFIAPQDTQIACAQKTEADAIEIHTGRYAHARGPQAIARELLKIKKAVVLGRSRGLVVHAGHGLNYENSAAICRFTGITELNIGHAIISRAVLVGLETAVEDMLTLIQRS